MENNPEESGPPQKSRHPIAPAEIRPIRTRAELRVVGMGGSAGGLEAFEQFFSHMPPDSGLAFVLVPHLEPTHKGMMPELLQRHTKMKVVEIKDGMAVEANCVYVIPPNADLSILHGKLQVFEPIAPRGLRTPIDFFFQHLAADLKENAIVILFSGMGSDGKLGLVAVKDNLGMVMVQDPASAKYDGMPRSAISTGVVDYIAPAEELPARLMQSVKYARRPQETNEPVEGVAAAALPKIFALLRAQSGNDFSCYKTNTVRRRIERRMSVHQFDSLPRYVRFLQRNSQEVELLYKELLIGVTSFFRDSGLFDVLIDKAIPQLLQSRAKDIPLRIWNPACSTGEETYSLAIAVKECLDAQRNEQFASGAVQWKDFGSAIQIFATDIDTDAVEKARRGIFTAKIAEEVSAQRLARFFLRDGDGYRIKKEIRDLILFAPQNILVDSPFTRLDLLCCRNLMIYVNAEAQEKLLRLMHYALKPDGLLVLGTAESVGHFTHLFAPLDNRWKIFQRQEVSERMIVEMPSRPVHYEKVPLPIPEKAKQPVMDIFYAAQRLLMDIYGPPAVVVSGEGDIIYVNGRTGKFLEPSSGKVNVNIFAMAREGLREELSSAIRSAANDRITITRRGVKVKSNGDFTEIDLTVKSVAEPAELRGMFLIVFQEVAAAAEKKPLQAVPEIPASELDAELRRTRERLQATIEEMQAAQEELRSTNEELQSNNEELQSTNEELTSSKEELQSLNEEMQTVNAELQSKIEELSQSNGDMKNLLNGIEIATIFLKGDLSIKRFTASASRIVNLVAGDVGRPIGHFATNLKYARLVEDAREVLDTLVSKEAQVQAHDGRWYNMRILPYRTLDNMIDGVVMTFADITALKQSNAQVLAARDYAQSIIATIREPLLVLDGKLRVVSASRSFYRIFHVAPAETEGCLIYELGQRQWDIPALRQLLPDILSQDKQFDDFQVEHDFPGIGHKVFRLNARRIASDGDGRKLILLALEDVTQFPRPTVPMERKP